MNSTQGNSRAFIGRLPPRQYAQTYIRLCPAGPLTRSSSRTTLGIKTQRPRRCSERRRRRPRVSVSRQCFLFFSCAHHVAEVARPFRAKLRRSFATVQDTPVRRYGGLKDQDRIFTNVYCRHDHGLKGAQVCPSPRCCLHYRS